jgi:hypothetical protein
MLIDLNEDTFTRFNIKKRESSSSIFSIVVRWYRIMKPKFKRLASENDAITFVLVDAENSPESRKLANVSNLPTFATECLVNETNQQTSANRLSKEIV